jgi:hypothetical protein
MAKMLEKSWAMQSEFTDDGEPAYITAIGNAVSSSQSAGKMQALETAKLEIAGQIETRMSSLININIANAQLSSVDGESITEIQQSAKNIVALKLGKVQPIVTMYRDRTTIDMLKKKYRKNIKLEPGKIEVQVILFYDVYQANDQAKEAIKNVMRDKLKDNEEELKKLMGL